MAEEDLHRSAYRAYMRALDPMSKKPRTTKYRECQSQRDDLSADQSYEDVLEDLPSDLSDSDTDQEQIGTDLEYLQFDDLETNFEDDNSQSDTPINIETKTIYDTCLISLDESALLLLQFVLCHKITGLAFIDLLALIRAHLPDGSIFFDSVHKLKNFFQKCADVPMIISNYCDKCLSPIPSVSIIHCPSCTEKLDGESQFIQLPITDQIQTFFTDPEFSSLIEYRFKRQKENNDSITDVYDGTLYQNLFRDEGILSNPYNLSLKLNTDGVSIFKSSSFHLWPIYFQINELPPEKRTLSKYRILAGLWCSKRKPFLGLLFKCLLPDFERLEKDGHQFILPDGKTVTSRILVLSGHFDTPAKDDFLDKNHHNGRFGCSFCEDPTVSTKTNKGSTTVYPFNAETSTGFGQNRTPESYKACALEAIHRAKAVLGVKGLCPFFTLKCFNVIDSIAVDYMHTVCLGVVKRLLTLWFVQSPETKNKPFNISRRVEEVDARLVKICPPNLITRTPRSIQTHLKHFKASELKSWLLHFGPICLMGILPVAYYNHFLYLVHGIYLLLSTSICRNDLLESEKCLKTFCLMMEELYGVRYMSINFHLLLHTVDSVRHLGPLWTSSCFSFESYNGELSDMFHGTQHVQKQIVNSVAFCQKVPQYIQVLKRNETAFKLMNDMLKKYRVSLKHKLGASSYIVGAQTKKTLSKLSYSDRWALLVKVGNIDKSTSVMTFNRVYIHGCVLHSSSYKRATKRNSYTVRYKTDNGCSYGCITYYVTFEFQGKQHNCAILSKLNIVSPLTNEHVCLHIVQVEPSSDIAAVYLDEITDVCVFMPVEDGAGKKIYVSSVPNLYESD